MKKRILTILLAACVCAGTVLCPIAGGGTVYAATENNFNYELQGDTATVTGYTDTSATKIEVPDTLGGKPVTSIGANAFISCDLTSITLPESVTSIGIGAFYMCGDLTSITLPNSVTSIGQRAFGYCSSLESINIPSGVTNIENSVFYQCGLKSITLPNGITSIGASAFYACNSLTSIAIPSSVTSIGASAFDGCFNLTGIDIPSSVTSIESYAFRRCSSLTSITIPGSVTNINYGTFNSCSSLENIIFQDGVTSIEWDVFSGCDSLTRVDIPSSVTSINDEEPFYMCDALKDIYYGGTKAQWADIVSGIELADSVVIHCSDGDINNSTGNTGNTNPQNPGGNTGGTSDNTTTPATLSKAAISAIANASQGIEITWNPVSNAAGYDVYRRVSGKAWGKIATVNGSVTKYVDTAVKSKNGTVYGYKIQAVNQGVMGEFSDEKIICRLKAPKLTSVKNNGSKKAVAKWNAVKKVKGYEIQYSTSRDFNNKAKIKKVKSASKESYTINKLKKKKTYYVRLRTYKKANGTTFYSAWSNIKKVKIKK